MSVKNSLRYSTSLSLILFWLAGCAQTPKDSATSTTGAVQAGMPVFVLSKTPLPYKTDPKANWCLAHYGDPLVINAEKINTNRRYFYPGQVIHKLLVGPSGSTAIILLHPQPDGNVLLYTSDNLPECLSNVVNLSPPGGAESLRYNNNHNIDFRLDLDVENGRTKITVEMPPAGTYGMTVSPCLDCQ